jgi:hypothetical protein
MLLLTVTSLFVAAEMADGDNKIFLSSAFFIVLGGVFAFCFFRKDLMISKPLNWLAKTIWPPGRWIIALLAAASLCVGLYQFVVWVFGEPS